MAWRYTVAFSTMSPGLLLVASAGRSTRILAAGLGAALALLQAALIELMFNSAQVWNWLLVIPIVLAALVALVAGQDTPVDRRPGLALSGNSS